MRILHAEFRNFRNLTDFGIEPEAGINVIYGDNAQGKTSVLEGIYYLCAGRSFRTRYDREAIAWPQNDSALTSLDGEIEKENLRHRLRVVLTEQDKHVFVDDKPLARLGLLWGQFNTVVFTPDDLQLVKGSPTVRRQFLDMELSRIHPIYLYNLQRYYEALAQRNALLKQSLSADLLEQNLAAWDEQLAGYGAEIFKHRLRHLGQLENEAAAHYRTMAQNEIEALTIEYQNFLRTSEDLAVSDAHDRFKTLLTRSREDDIRRGATHTGPHRDDFVLRLEDRDARDFASQGQQRSIVLAIKIALVGMIERESGTPPVLLFDDLTSELDELRRSRLLTFLEGARQIFLTTTDRRYFREIPGIRKSFRIRAGQLIPEDT